MRGRRIVALWQQIPSVEIAGIFCRRAVDAVVLDLEHGAWSDESVLSCVLMVRAHGKRAVVRVSKRQRDRARAAIDYGADGLIFSTVESVRDCEEIRGLATLPTRGVGLVAANDYGTDTVDYGPSFLVAQIETRRAVENIQAIYDQMLFDFYMIGPYDLSSSCGDAGNFSSEAYRAAVATVKATIPERLLGCHILRDYKAALDCWKRAGFVALSTDALMAAKGASDLCELL